jgi:3-hydroxyacyl-CoA dehydrogenase/enoyl-CoA hydratase/3-hydroxybutyryl-CoA epimerase
MEVKKAAVVGAGAMGGGIAYLLSAAGISVVVKDVVEQQVDLARDHMRGIYQRRVARGQIDVAVMQQGLERVSYTLDYRAFGDVDLAIEAVPEDMEIKARVFRELDRACPPHAILASNTSALSISEMGRASGRPQNVLGMHFFNPAHVMKLVEVIPGAETNDEVVATVLVLARQLGKEPVLVRECPGFLVNRVLMPYLNEAVICLQEGAASMPEIDAALGPDGFGWPMGPFTLMDMLGLDVCHHIITYLDAQYGERIREAALLRELVAAGKLGRKVGAGFYAHPARVPSAQVGKIVSALQASGEVERPRSAFSVDRLVLALVNEAFFCLGEEIASAEDIDRACVLGLGMAVRLVDERVPLGPLAYVERTGASVALDRLRHLERTLGSRFRPAPALVARAEGRTAGEVTGPGGDGTSC